MLGTSCESERTAVVNWVLSVGAVPEQDLKARLGQILISILSKVSPKHKMADMRPFLIRFREYKRTRS